MSEKKSFASRLSELLHKNGFLKIISVLLAIIVWAYILYAIDPVNEKVFNKISVNMAFEGSIPDQNGYMYLLTDTNFTVSVTVSGSRSELLNFDEDDIKASLNLNEGISEGVCDVKVVIDTGNKDVAVADYSPKSIPIRFAEKKEAEFEIGLKTEGTLPEGYFIESSAFDPQRIRITGPAEEISQIDKAYVKINQDNLKSDIAGTYDIFLVDKEGANVPRQNLTISSLTAETKITVNYKKKLKTSAAIVNESGGNESAYLSVILDKASVQATGDAKALLDLESCRIPVDTSQITASGTYTFEIEPINGITLDQKEISAQVIFADGLATKQITFNDPTHFEFADGVKGRVNQPVTVTVRARAEDLPLLTSDTLRCQLIASKTAETGEYAVLVTPISINHVNFGVVGSQTVPQNKVVVE